MVAAAVRSQGGLFSRRVDLRGGVSRRGALAAGAERLAGARPPLREAIAEIARFIRRHREVRTVLFRNGLFNFFMAVIPTVLPTFGLKVLGIDAGGLSLLFTALGMSSIVGGASLVPFVQKKLSPNVITVAACALLALAFCVMGVVRQAPAFFGAAAVAGSAWMIGGFRDLGGRAAGHARRGPRSDQRRADDERRRDDGLRGADLGGGGHGRRPGARDARRLGQLAAVAVASVAVVPRRLNWRQAQKEASVVCVKFCKKVEGSEERLRFWLRVQS